MRTSDLFRFLPPPFENSTEHPNLVPSATTHSPTITAQAYTASTEHPNLVPSATAHSPTITARACTASTGPLEPYV